MKFGRWIMDGSAEPCSHKKAWLQKRDGYFDFDRRATDLDDEGGLVAFRVSFTKGKARRIVLRATALGVFEAYVNGVRVGIRADRGVTYDEMKPGWTDYRNHVFAFEYDITELCREDGENDLVICVANGWWGGRISYGFYGYAKCGFCGEIEKQYAGGGVEMIASDGAWKTAQGGRVRSADIWNGELYDGREPDIAADPEAFEWRGAELYDGVTCKIVPHIGETVRMKRVGIRPISAVVYDGVRDNGTDFGEVCVRSRREGKGCEVGRLKKGERLLLDMGYDHTGRPSLRFSAARGVTLRVFCAEMLNDSGSRARGNDGAAGSAYIENYRSALSRVQVISGGGLTEYAPLYTFYGYRYLELVADGDVDIVEVSTGVIGSDVRRCGRIETDNAEVNRLIDNIYRGMESNYLSIPTDCPQRDERLGWTGDAQLFCGAAAYFAGVDGFFRKWMMDMRDSQRPEGAFAYVAPRVWEGNIDGCCAWSDAGLIVPYKMRLMYGDEEIVRENYDAMERYMRFLEEEKECGIRGPRPVFGDWLSYEATPKPYVSVCYYAYDALLMAKMSRLLGREDRVSHYEALRKRILTHYRDRFMENGEITVRTQTGYLLPLSFDMLAGEERTRAIEALRNKLEDNEYTLSTGFLGTGLLNSTLSAVGLDDAAYSLLLQTRDPSWLYSVRQGATTVWERWNSYNHERGFGDVSMNSFNHYAYGAVAEWMFGGMAGIRPCEETPGFRRFILAPRPDLRSDADIPDGQERIRRVTAEYDSASGLIRSAWSLEDGVFVYRVTVPSGTTAHVELPLIYGSCRVLVNGSPVCAEERDGCALFELPAGSYVIIDEKNKRRSLRCKIYPQGTSSKPAFVVICARYEGKWLLSRHKRRDTWETQGGHVESGESPFEAARRELFEESGICDATLYPVCDYLGYDDFGSAEGAVFLADVHCLGPLPESEMKEVRLFDALPDTLTYPAVTPRLMEQALRVARERGIL